MKRTLFASIALASIGLSALAFAEPGNDVDQIVYTHEKGEVVQATQTIATPVAQVAQPASVPFTYSQKAALAQGKGIRPGVYRIRSLHSGRCMVVSSTDATPPVETWDCENRDGWQHGGLNNFWVILPSPLGGYTLRGHPQRLAFSGERPRRVGELGSCLTVARGVQIAAPRIELRACEPQGGDWVKAGAPDQRFFALPASGGGFQFAVAEAGDGAECINLRDGGRGDGTGVIRWPCAATSDQIWQLDWMEPVRDGYENDLLAEGNWYRTPSGHFNILGADGLDLTGMVYESFATSDDGGDYCRKRCAELDQCKAWTWTGRGYVTNSNDPPMCYWKKRPGEAINRGPATFGKLRSGIVRP